MWLKLPARVRNKQTTSSPAESENIFYNYIVYSYKLKEKVKKRKFLGLLVMLDISFS